VHGIAAGINVYPKDTGSRKSTVSGRYSFPKNEASPAENPIFSTSDKKEGRTGKKRQKNGHAGLQPSGIE
jgi:hypothetical protein